MGCCGDYHTIVFVDEYSLLAWLMCFPSGQPFGKLEPESRAHTDAHKLWAHSSNLRRSSVELFLHPYCSGSALSASYINLYILEHCQSTYMHPVYIWPR